ncbi:hypothetical protein [Janthinobacterium psychrotolerans]|uniref:Uncharacterized protein n=1 Tax=Janthinobacterium psychrotolerans TaxID=1747903 RepID=A0A1A7CBG1_9BURK|nr:hypothetical protein [Janthinobacterium psychrotolerans]OBV41643.1 hypothetical protein ASR47_10403 [Janthinobacterium psychrotolerans]
MAEPRSEIIHALRRAPGYVVRTSFVVAFFICAIVVDFLKNVFDRIAPAPSMVALIIVLTMGLVALWKYSPSVWRMCCRPDTHFDRKLKRESGEREAKRLAKRQEKTKEKEEEERKRLAEFDRKQRLRALIGYDKSTSEQQKQQGGQQ